MVIIKRNTANKYRNKTYQVLLWLFERNENFQRAIFFIIIIRSVVEIKRQENPIIEFI